MLRFFYDVLTNIFVLLKGDKRSPEFFKAKYALYDISLKKYYRYKAFLFNTYKRKRRLISYKKGRAAFFKRKNKKKKKYSRKLHIPFLERGRSVHNLFSFFFKSLLKTKTYKGKKRIKR